MSEITGCKSGSGSNAASLREPPFRDTLYGWEQRTWYVPCDWKSRGQAKAFIAWDMVAPFTELRTRRVFLHERTVTEQEAADLWLEDWEPTWRYWVGCKASDEGAYAFWEVTWPRG